MGDVKIIPSLLMNFCVLLVLGGVSLSNGAGAPHKNVICYFHFMSLRYPGVTNYTIADIDPSICTHLVYYFHGLSSPTLQRSDGVFSNTAEWEQWENLRLVNPSLKTILSVYDFYQVTPVTPYENRQKFINNATDLLRKWNFDGFEYLSYRDISPAVMVFLEEMHAAFATEATSSGRDPLILMLTFLGASGRHIEEGVDVGRLVEAVDMFHVMRYWYSVPFENETGLQNPFCGNGTNNIDENVSRSISYYLEAGLTPEKVHMGFQLSATTFTLSNPQLTGVGAPVKDQGKPGDYTKMEGKLSYYEVCERLQEELYISEADPEGVVNFAYKGDQWMSFEDPASIAIKMDYVCQHNLGGVAVWHLHEDDYTGQFCNQGRYPLTSTLYKLAASECPSPMTTPQPQTCPYSTDRFPDPYSSQHYLQCACDMLFRVTCDLGLTYDAVVKECVENPAATCA